jgi:DNA polymerase-1
MKPRIFLFDAYALIFRAYYAFINRPMINSKGRNTSAIYGFTSTLLDILKKENPEYLAVAFDPPSRTFRNDMYEAYKANRMATPEEIKKSVPVIKEILEAMCIPVLEVIGFEADDVIGTMAGMAEKEDMQVFMVTPDKDYTQLVTENIRIYRPSRLGKGYEVLGIREVQEAFGVTDPVHVIDVLALWGDASDNIPGAPGIGEKTAKDLISRYGTVEEIWNKLGELKPKQQETFTVNREQILLSKRLATIHTAVPVGVGMEELKLRPWNEAKLRSLFTELEFRSFLSALDQNRKEPVQTSLFGDEGKPSAPDTTKLKTVQSVSHHYELVNGETAVDELVIKLLEQKEVCFDTETTGLNTREADLVGMSFSFRPFEAFYVPCPAERKECLALLEKFRPFFAHKGIKKIGQNLKFDMAMLMQYGLDVEGEIFDTMIGHYLIQPDLSHNMDYLSEIYLKYKPVSITELIGKGPGQKNMRDVDLSVIAEYAAEDADVTLQLYPILRKELEKLGLLTLAEQIEMPLVRVLAEMEYAGFRISVENLQNYAVVLKEELAGVESAIFALADVRFNINSPRQLGEILFERLKISDGAAKTKTNQYSTSEEVLVKLADRHPIVNLVLDYRAMQKLLSTYVEALPGLIDKHTGKIHTSFDQAWVSTGRLSSKNPNLQNIPIRDERGKEIRKAFIPSDDDHVLVSADYSQIELRLMAHLSRDSHMIDAFCKEEDIHTATAAKVFKVSESEVTPAMRSRAKTANFGIIYGISAFGLSQRLNISRGEAGELIRGYFETYPDVKVYMERAVQLAKEKGYAETLLGRRRFLPDLVSANAVVRGVAERNAINAPIQGSAADIIKQAMVKIQERLRKDFKTRMILQVHDELIFDVALPELEEVKSVVRHEMEHALQLSVPLVVDMGTGKSWLEAH